MREAIILLGGRATRFRPYTDDKPKALIKINDKPILQHQIEWLKEHDVKHIILAAGYKSNMINSYIFDKFVEDDQVGITIVKEKERLGTGGAIRNAMKKLIDSDEFLVVNGDNISNVDLDKIYKNGASTITAWNDTYRFGIMVMDDKGNINFTEKPEFWINAGITLLDKKRMKKMLPKKGSLEKEVLPNLELKVHYHGNKKSEYWYTFDSQRDKEEFERKWKKQN